MPWYSKISGWNTAYCFLPRDPDRWSNALPTCLVTTACHIYPLVCKFEAWNIPCDYICYIVAITCQQDKTKKFSVVGVVYPSVNLTACTSRFGLYRIPLSLSVYLLACLPVHLPAFLLACLSVGLPVCWPICLSVHLSACLSASPLVHLSMLCINLYLFTSADAMNLQLSYESKEARRSDCQSVFCRQFVCLALH